jgi:xanthine dehydrogenase accessory factor
MVEVTKEKLIIVRGAGDLASGTIHKLARCGFPVVALERDNPSVIRRLVSFANAYYEDDVCIEGIEAVRVYDAQSALEIAYKGIIPLLIDEAAVSVSVIKPDIVVDAIVAKRNLGTHINMAPVVIGLGPGFTAGVDCHVVVETNRGHNLGRVLFEGGAEPNTGVPGVLGGYGFERIVRAPASDSIRTSTEIGDTVEKGDVLGYIGEAPVIAPLTGVLRGFIHDGVSAIAGRKIGDVDPRNKPEYCDTISDKSRAVAGGVLEAILIMLNRNEKTLP